jgi:chromosome segregation ATPase
MTAHLLYNKEEEVMRPEEKPRFRDRFNPMFYIRKELQKIMNAIERLTAQQKQLAADVEELQNNITAEHAQQTKLVEELKAASNGANNEAELNAIADKLQASIDSVKGASTAVKAIVPDEEPVPQTGAQTGTGETGEGSDL